MNRPDRRQADERTIRAVLAGNVDAFARLVEAYQHRLYNSVARMVGNAEDAEDIVQDAFVQAFRKLDTFRANSSFFTWIYRIAINGAINFHRRQRRAPMLTNDFAGGSGNEVVVQDSPSRALESTEQAAQVQRAMMDLSDEHRRVLVMREIDDLSYEDIAEILDLPVGTVRSRLHRARLQLKELMVETEEPTTGNG